MIRAIIVDDEQKSRNTLSVLLSRYCTDVTVLTSAADVKTAVSSINKLKPELIFLDISMPDGTGFDVINGINIGNYEVIFTTAYDEYALQAIKADAVDYLLKPINIEDLQLAVDKAILRIENRRKIFHLSENQILDKANASFPGKIAIPDNDGLHFIDISDIIYLEAKGTYTEFYCLNNLKYLSSKSLKENENILPADKFFRAHHSYIINLNFIQKYHKGNGGYVTMLGGADIDISKRKKKQFMELFHL